MRNKRIIKTLIIVITLCLTILETGMITNAASYNYDFWKNALPSSEGLSYKDTYYGKDILSLEDSSQSLTFNTLEDMQVYKNQIFLLDSRNEASAKIKISINTVDVEIQGVSSVCILNQEMKYVTAPINEFEITKGVYNKLSEYYNFETPLSEITPEQFTAQNLKNKAPYIPILKESTLEGTSEYSGASIILNNAQGITVVDDGDSYAIYIADTDNSRVLKMNSSFVVTDVYLTPDDAIFFQWNSNEVLEESTKRVFKPIKIAVDKTKRVYCVAKYVYEGIIEFSNNGKFNRFLGKNTVTANPLKQFWYKLMSEAQISSQALTLPPEFINITIDQDGFLYTTSYPDADDPTAADMIKSINTSGKDVLRRNGYVKPNGDATFLSASTNKEAILGSSTLTAIAVSSSGFYSVTDAKRGRIFTYDTEGNLLYISGEKGTLSDSLNDPVAISYLTIEATEVNEKEELVLVLDKTSKSIISFTTSSFGALVNKATELYLDNDIIGAEQYWRNVIKMNSNYELGYVGIGKSLLRLGQYEEAMSFFRLGHNATYYSKAYQQYRDDILKENFSIIMSGLVITVVGLGVLSFLKHQNKKKQGYVSEVE